jgi:hypothetical protein
MTTDYTTALAGLAGLLLVFTGMVVFVLNRPTDLPRQS